MAKKDNPKQNQSAHSRDSQTDRSAYGKSLRDVTPRKEHAAWKPTSKRRNPIEILEESNKGRIPELIPIRYGRMMQSPFTFYRGSAALMASDLSHTPVTRLQVQACGDCHLLNFGGYATPERNLVLDINDFDETLPAPWEWDLKRLATSFVLACRSNGFKPSAAREAASTVTKSYRTAMQKFSTMRALDVWYSRKSLDAFIDEMGQKGTRENTEAMIKKVKERSVADYYVPKLTVEVDGRRIFKDTPPLVFHSQDQRGQNFVSSMKHVVNEYRESLHNDRRVLFDRYQLQDVAYKVVGIGSVGTACGIALLTAGADDPLILQVKEARTSVLEPYTGKSVYKNQAQRVVEGQRLMQAASDIFLGWTTGKSGHHFFIRQLKDMKMSLTPEVWTPVRAIEIAGALGWVLARAHARSGDAVMISGYMGSSDVFDNAIADFSVAYADQTERDYKVFVGEIKSGRLEAVNDAR
jgi:uncharacterized protein (DUF2252 family)